MGLHIAFWNNRFPEQDTPFCSIGICSPLGGPQRDHTKYGSPVERDAHVSFSGCQNRYQP
jgi:hypothetical protein